MFSRSYGPDSAPNNLASRFQIRNRHNALKTTRNPSTECKSNAPSINGSRQEDLEKLLSKHCRKTGTDLNKDCVESVIWFGTRVRHNIDCFRFVCLPSAGVDFEPTFCHRSSFGGSGCTIFSILERYRPKFASEYNRNWYRINIGAQKLLFWGGEFIRTTYFF